MFVVVMITSVSRVERFNAAHRLYNPKWSNEKNDAVFGLCNNPNFHGHNYKLIVKVTGEVDQETGFLIDLKDLKSIIRTEIHDKFQNLNPTAENIAYVIWHKLREAIDSKLELKVTLFETERNIVEYEGR